MSVGALIAEAVTGLLALFVIAFGIYSCREGYLRASGPAFRVGDLFRHRPMHEKPRAQLVIEGIFGIAVGIIALAAHLLP